MSMDYYRSTATKNLMRAVAGEPDGIPIVDPSTPEGRDYLFRFRDPDSGKAASRGHDPSQYRPDMQAAPLGMKTYTPSEIDAIYDEQEAKQNSLEHLYLEAGWKNLDQDGDGYCWGYSLGHAIMMRRTALHMPHVRLNPHSVCSIIKGGRDEGGWCGLSLKKAREIGMAEEGTGPGQWPLHSRDYKRFNDPAVKASMLKYKVTDDWYDLGRPEYGQQLKDDQLATCLSDLCPCPVDYNEWSHSICGMRWARVERAYYAPMILNSWLGWGRQGLAIIQRSWHHDGAVSVVSTVAA
jgi:hypothetical protein